MKTQLVVYSVDIDKKESVVGVLKHDRSPPGGCVEVGVGMEEGTKIAAFVVKSDNFDSKVEGATIEESSLYETVDPSDNEITWCTTSPSRAYCVFVFIHILPGTTDAFIAASKDNASNSRNEDGIYKFDLLRNVDNPHKFVLREIYHEADVAPVRHKETEHYARWRDTVSDLMAEPRTALKLMLL